MPLEPPPKKRGYHIRRFKPDDKSEFLSLFSTVFGLEYPPDWFDWRYDNPYLDAIPVVIAEKDGELVGSRSFLACYVSHGNDTVLALQPTAAMVHPDHRRQGIFSRMIEWTFESYADREPGLIFNFPSAAAKAANLKLGWREVGRIPVWYRLNRGMRGSTVIDGLNPHLATLGVTLGEVGLRIRSRLRVTNFDGEIRKHMGVPAALLETLYHQTMSAQLHVRRDQEYYEWRYGNPMWNCSTHVAHRDGDPVGALITATRGGDKTVLMDSLPLPGSDRDPIVFDRLLNAVIADNHTTPILRTAGSIAPNRLLWQYGFLPDGLPIASRITSNTEMVACPLDDTASAWELGDSRIDRSSEWIVSLGDTDAPYYHR